MNALQEHLIHALGLVGKKEYGLCTDAVGNEDGKTIPGVYKGYIAAMGSAITQSGLLPTLAYYSEKSSSKDDRMDGDPKLLLNLILVMLRKRDSSIKADTLLKLAIERYKMGYPDLRRLQQEIITASIALKLAMRTFTLDKS
jgi:CRISPR type III-B/RAMP module-associated protein Cmr5